MSGDTPGEPVNSVARADQVGEVLTRLCNVMGIQRRGPICITRSRQYGARLFEVLPWGFCFATLICNGLRTSVCIVRQRLLMAKLFG